MKILKINLKKQHQCIKKQRGLLRKNYLINIETNTAGGVYVFDSAENALEWFDSDRIAFLSERYSTTPDIKYFYSPVEVNNETNKIFII